MHRSRWGVKKTSARCRQLDEGARLHLVDQPARNHPRRQSLYGDSKPWIDIGERADRIGALQRLSVHIHRERDKLTGLVAEHMAQVLRHAESEAHGVRSLEDSM